MDPYDTSAVRRAVHACPETAFLEIRTAALVWEVLGGLSWHRRAGQKLVDLSSSVLPHPTEFAGANAEARSHGVSDEDIERFQNGATTIIADMQGNRPGPRVGMRFDMDALPVGESQNAEHLPNVRGFASAHSGRMHACGHDGHIAVALRLAALLSANRDFAGSVRLIFQPAEEGVRGAKPIVDAGLCDDVDVFITVHLGFGAAKNSIGYATGLFGTSKFETHFEGHAVHASNSPETGRNALLAAAHAVLALHALPRFSHAQTRVNVGYLNCEGASNVIPGGAVMRSEIRASDATVHEDLEERALRIFENASALNSVTSSTTRTGYAVAAQSDVELYESIVGRSVEHGFTAGGPHPMFASDDATLMMERVTQRGGASCYLVVGSGDFGPHHSSLFDLDEDVLPRTSDVLERFIRDQ